MSLWLPLEVSTAVLVLLQALLQRGIGCVVMSKDSCFAASKGVEQGHNVYDFQASQSGKIGCLTLGVCH